MIRVKYCVETTRNRSGGCLSLGGIEGCCDNGVIELGCFKQVSMLAHKGHSLTLAFQRFSLNFTLNQASFNTFFRTRRHSHRGGNISLLIRSFSLDSLQRNLDFIVFQLINGGSSS